MADRSRKPSKRLALKGPVIERRTVHQAELSEGPIAASDGKRLARPAQPASLPLGTLRRSLPRLPQDERGCRHPNVPRRVTSTSATAPSMATTWCPRRSPEIVRFGASSVSEASTRALPPRPRRSTPTRTSSAATASGEQLGVVRKSRGRCSATACIAWSDPDAHHGRCDHLRRHSSPVDASLPARVVRHREQHDRRALERDLGDDGPVREVGPIVEHPARGTRRLGAGGERARPPRVRPS